MKETVNYTVQDIERYHNGGLSPAQMHALEKAALDDPFLTDALEGYAFTKTSSADKATLQQKLAVRIKKEEKQKAVFLLQPWMRIAAIFIIIVGGGWLIIQSLTSSFEKKLAFITPGNNQQVQGTNQPISADSASTDSDASVTNETAVNNKAALNTHEPGEYKTKDKDIVPYKPLHPRLPQVVRSDNNLDAVAIMSSAEADKNFRLQIDSTNELTTARKKVFNESNTADTIRNVDVVLQKSERELEEVVVVKQKPQANPARARQMMMQVDTLEPANGWGYFDDYIASNLKSPDALKMKPVNGEVELSFELNKEGEPVNIIVTKSLCERCDAEAIRLLKDGPKWKKKAKKGKVKIKF